jgi:hypothetical protein
MTTPGHKWAPQALKKRSATMKKILAAKRALGLKYNNPLPEGHPLRGNGAGKGKLANSRAKANGNGANGHAVMSFPLDLIPERVTPAPRAARSVHPELTPKIALALEVMRLLNKILD